ncbi:aldo/keto reductase [Micromonospora sp. 4G55]|uniref:aldo/keto reductase n=1 Tax=Micromonospora sp. 4G55 TaxID=2806102 RepID=UPI001EE3D927|nr:aldo/keto reductase [Micromonospora sp. 4G55]
MGENMRYTRLGGNGPQIRAIGLGCMGMSWGYDEDGRDDAHSVAVIHRAIELGCNLLDTADLYGPFTNERLVGRALRGRRDQVVLATKGGLLADGGRTVHRNGRPEHLRAACEASLLRLGVDHVDLYQLHRVDPAVPIEESWGTLAELVTEGKARMIGLSEVSVDEIRRAEKIHPVASVQSELSLWTREPLDSVLPYCTEQQITFLPFAPLGRGFLTGRFAGTADLPVRDGRRNLPRFQPDTISANQEIARRVVRISSEMGSTPAQVALAWLLALADNVVPIPGTKTLSHLEDNMAADSITLTADARSALDALPEPVGTRY